MLSGTCSITCLMVASLIAQASASPQTGSATPTTRTPPTAQTPPAAQTPPTSQAAGEAHSSALEPELDSPTSTTTAPPATTSLKAENTTMGGIGTAMKNLKNNYKNATGANAADKKASESAPVPISQGTFELMTAFLSVGLLAVVA
ncbi:hypothetical protein PGT21_030985 [Puccinia graminis f. sp. tritici]|uniref:Uncharacterized protein n=1 Tax=Puccinia graminis f. sp. tritici TaxID=56615 RepID=A0A5B0PPD5_PUCGR|nr:hypothetical protein PGT21_030985 [Puccinia graminis f. sp. tritici]KAA1133949.1 hypothetical protein PGTUg99_033261 [Puccinia graminis f. sp. tritici]